MNQLRDQIADVLSSVTEKSNLPKLLEYINTTEGYKTVEAMIIEMMEEEGISASGCLYYINEQL